MSDRAAVEQMEKEARLRSIENVASHMFMALFPAMSKDDEVLRQTMRRCFRMAELITDERDVWRNNRE